MGVIIQIRGCGDSQHTKKTKTITLTAGNDYGIHV